MRLQGKVVVITGASSGIGRATATLFAREGAKVIVADINEELGRGAVDEIQRAGGEAVFVKADVSKARDAERVVKTAIARYGRLDVLHNNAGIGFLGTVVDTSEQDWDRIMAVNVKGVFLMSKYAIPEMAKNGGGVIVNTASNWGLVAQPNWAAYCTTKGAVVNLTRAMAIDHAHQNIRVNALCPGYVRTPLLMKAIADSADPKSERIECARLATPDEMAHGALFLASDESIHMTGACLVMDNAETARGGAVKTHLPLRKQDIDEIEAMKQRWF